MKQKYPGAKSLESQWQGKKSSSINETTEYDGNQDAPAPKSPSGGWYSKWQGKSSIKGFKRF